MRVWLGLALAGLWTFLLFYLPAYWGRGRARQADLVNFPIFSDQPSLYKDLAWFDFMGTALLEFNQIKKGRQDRPDQWEAMAILTDEKRATRALKLWQEDLARDLFLLSGLIPSALIASPFLAFLVLALMALRAYASSYELKRQARAIKRAAYADLPGLLTKLVLAMRAGSLANQAWLEVARSDAGPLYQEMERVVEDRMEGVGVDQAYRSFGRRFHMEGLDQLAMLYAQHLSLGGEELLEGLDRVRQMEIQVRKRSLKKEADRASQKMVFPSLLVFTAIMVLVIVPILNHSLGF